MNSNLVSQRVQSLSPSATLAMSQKSAELKAQGVDVINLSVGEPDFFTPDHIKQAARQAVDDNYSFYSPVPGYLSLRQAISAKLKRENNLDYAPEQIVVGNGAKHALANVIMAVVDPGDEVILPTPAWVSYEQLVILAGGKVVPVPTTMEQGFKLTPGQLEAAITPATKLVLLASPVNPTGAVYSEQEMQALATTLAKYPDVVILSDEIYEHINYIGKHTSLAQFPEIAQRVAIINGVSKAYAMTGWRIGFVAAPLPLAKAVAKLQGQMTSGASSIAQKAAEQAYLAPQDCVEHMRKQFERRRDLIVGLMRQIPGMELNVPDGAFYIFPRVTQLLGKTTPEGQVLETAGDLAMYLLHEAHVACVSGDAFAAPGFLRMSYATSDDNITRACERIAAAVAKLQ